MNKKTMNWNDIMTKEEAIRLAKEEVEDWGLKINEDKTECTGSGFAVFTDYFIMKGNKISLQNIKRLGWCNAGDRRGNEVRARKERSFYKEFTDEERG